MDLNLSWPAVSHSCSLTRAPPRSVTSREKKSTPTVGSLTSANFPSEKYLGSNKVIEVSRGEILLCLHLNRELFPTVLSPIRMSRN